MAKRPSLLDNFKENETKVEQQPSAEVVEITPAAKKAKPKVVQNTIYLPPKVHRRLKEIAFSRNCKVHDLFIEGIDHVLGSKGWPSVEEMVKE